jgi:hypothetical protein
MGIDYEEFRKIIQYGVKSGLVRYPDPPKEEESEPEFIEDDQVLKKQCRCGEMFAPRTSRLTRCDDCLNKVVNCVICGVEMKIRYKNSDEYVKSCSNKDCVREHLSRTKKIRDKAKKDASR